MTVGYLGLSRHSLTFRDLRLLGLSGHSRVAVVAIRIVYSNDRFQKTWLTARDPN